MVSSAVRLALVCAFSLASFAALSALTLRIAHLCEQQVAKEDRGMNSRGHMAQVLGVREVESMSDDVGSFDTPTHALDRALLQPVHRFLDMRQGAGVFLAGERAGLETAQPVGNDGKQRLLRKAVHALLRDRSVLKEDVGPESTLVLRVRVNPSLVMVMRPSCARLVHDGNVQAVVRGIDLVVFDKSHALSPIRHSGPWLGLELGASSSASPMPVSLRWPLPVGRA